LEEGERYSSYVQSARKEYGIFIPHTVAAVVSPSHREVRRIISAVVALGNDGISRSTVLSDFMKER
jgi:hypothetical protein